MKMAVKGAAAKAEITSKILAAFPGSFQYDKEIRVPVMENGEEVQIKVVLTAAKVNVANGADTALPGDFPAPVNAPVTPEKSGPIEPTAEEKANVSALLRKLGL
jgi:hypothetical protein